MRRTMLRRALTWTALALFLALLLQALVLVWTANERQWYIDGGGITATLDMTLTDTARWFLTALLGGLILLCLLALAADLASGRRTATRQYAPADMTQEFRAVSHPSRADDSPVQDEPEAVPPTREPERGRYASTIVGDRAAGRMEESLSIAPPTERQVGSSDTLIDRGPAPASREQSAPPKSAVEDTVQMPRAHTVQREAPPRTQDTARLHTSGRR